MKKVKLLCLMILIGITCTGCTVEYNLDISKNSIEETINVTDYTTSTRTKTDILNHYNQWYPTYVNYIPEGETIELEDFNQKADGVEYYEKSIEETDNGYKYTYKYIHQIDKYYDAYVLASTFLETTVYEGSDSLVIKTSDKNFLCDYDYFENVKVNITIDPEVYKLNYTNASNINNNTYTWTLDRSNCEDSQIVLTLDKEINYDDFLGEDTNDDKNNTGDTKNATDYTMYIFCGILILIIILGYFILKKIKEKSEKIDLDD